MKIKSPREYLNEALGIVNSEDQQAARDAVKNGVVTPALAAALSLKVEEAVREHRANPADTGLATKVELLTNALRAVEQRLKDNAASRETGTPTKDTETMLKHVQGLRDDMRGMQDGLAALRPYHRKKIIWVAVAIVVIGFVAGCVAGWYGCIDYYTREHNRSVRAR